MSDTLLRSGLIRLAYANPHLRADLLPLIEKEAAGPSYKDYVDKKRKKGEKPLDEAAWESRVKGKGEGGKSEDKGDKGSEGGGKSLSPADGKKLGEALSQWHESGSDPIYAVSSNAAAGKPIPPEAAKKALSKIDTLLMGDMSPADKKQLSSAKAMLEKVTGAKSEGGGKSKSEKPKKTYKKNYRPTMESVMNKHGLTDDDAAEVIQFSIDRPKKGKEQSPAELMRRFMEKAKPETKERMKGMNPQEFMKMLRAVLDDEEGGGGKTASLRNGLIRLAYANPSLRPTLLPLITKHAGDMDADADPTSHDQNLPEHYYFNKGAAKGESVEAEVKQFASPKSKDQNKPEHYYGLPPKGKQASAPVAIEKAKKGDSVTVTHKGEKVTGKVVRVKADGTVTVDLSGQHSDEDVGYVDFKIPKGKQASIEHTAMDFPSEAALKQYLRDHPGADKKKHKVRKDTTYEKHHAKVEEAVKDKFNDVTSHLSDTGLSEDEAFGDSEMASLGNKWFSVSRVKLNDAKNSADREKLNAVEKELGELAGKMKARITELAKSKKGKQASVKVAAGPDAAGRNWKKHTTAGITNWFWQGRPGEPIKQFMVIQKKDGAFDNSYWMTVKLEDGSFFQSPIQKAKPTDWFKRAAEIYAASQGMVLDFSEMPEKWKRLNGPAPVKTAGGSGAANAAFLRQSPLKNKVLQAVAKHYGVSVSEIEDELTDPDAEALYEYIGNDRALQMQVYREFKSKGF